MSLNTSLTALSLVFASLALLQTPLYCEVASASPAERGMKEICMNVVAPPIYSAPGSGTLTALACGKELGLCPLRHTDMHASVAGQIATVTVKQVFQNKFRNTIEAIYTFPLSTTGAISEMVMKVGNRTIRATLKQREDARALYEQAKKGGQMAALLDQERPNVFTQAVANILPGQTVEIEIKYVEQLVYENGSFTLSFPTTVGPRFVPGWETGRPAAHGMVADTNLVPDASRITPPSINRTGRDISIAVDIDAGLPIQKVECLTHQVEASTAESGRTVVQLVNKSAIPNKDFVLKWKVATDAIKTGLVTYKNGSDGYFSLVVSPPHTVRAEDLIPREMIFVVDCSGSQRGKPLEKAKETLKYIVDRMNPNDTFQIVRFSDTCDVLSPQPLKFSPEMRERALTFIERLTADGGTCMSDVVEKINSMPPAEDRLRIVTIMTDGFIGNDFEVLGMIRKHRGNSRWFSFGTGDSVNRFLIDGIAKEGGGEADYVLLNSRSDLVAEEFNRRISSPILTDLKVDFHGLPVQQVFPRTLNDLWANKTVLITGRFNNYVSGVVTLTGHVAGKTYTQDIPVKFTEAQNSHNAAIEKLWAREKIDDLVSQNYFAAQRGAGADNLKTEIIRTSLEHGVMSQYTSLVAVEETRTTTGESRTVVVPAELPNGMVSSLMPTGGAGSPSPARAGGAAVVNSCQACPDYGLYMADLQRRVKKQWYPPRGAESKRAVVKFKLNRDGTVDNVQMARSSGIGSVDSAALNAVRAASPMRSLPADSPNSVDIEFTFDYSTFGGVTGNRFSSSAAGSSAAVTPSKKLSAVLQRTVQQPSSPLQFESVVIDKAKVMVRVTLTRVDKETLTKLSSKGFELKSLMHNEVLGWIKIADLNDLCDVIEVIRVDEAKKELSATVKDKRSELQSTDSKQVLHQKAEKAPESRKGAIK